MTSAALTSVTLGSSVASIGLAAFDGDSLTVYCFGAHDASQVTGGFTTPTWRGYHTVEQPTVTFNLDGHGSAVVPQNLTIGATPTQPADPTATDFDFTGWYTSPALTTKYDFADPVTTNTTVYAGWAALAVTGVDISPLTVPIGTGVIILGIAFLVVAARRRSRYSAR